MPRCVLLAAAATTILTVAASDAGAAVRMPTVPAMAGVRADNPIRPAIVMFDLAIIRMRMLNTLTELIRGDRARPARHW